MKAMSYYVIPGCIIGFIILRYILGYVESVVGFEVVSSFNFGTCLTGFVLASVLTLYAMIEPLYNSVQVELRDALDPVRNKAAASVSFI